MYVIGTDWPFVMSRAETDPKKGEIWIGGDYSPVEGVAPAGIISALDPATGKIVWQRRGPIFASGALVAGGLLFVGDTQGWFRAYDARTGETLWEFFCGAGVSSGAASFELDGQQTLAVVAAGSRYTDLRGSALLLFGVGSGNVSLAGKPRADAETARAPAAPRAAPVANEAWPPAGAVAVGRFAAYDAKTRTAWLTMNAGPSMAFNGAVHGVRTLEVPVGWSLEVRFRNRDAVPHSVRVIDETTTMSLNVPPAAFANAETSNADTGSPNGARSVFTIRADRAGRYLLACAVPGHASAGMYVRLVVSGDVAVPSYR